jgi:hypothetical protein
MSAVGNNVRASPKLSEGLLRFLGSLGQRSEAELYLRIFQSLSRTEFALLVPDSEVLRDRAGTLAEQLRFLRELDLYPTIVLDALDATDDGAAAHLYAALLDVGLEAVEYHAAEGVSFTEAAEVPLTEDQLLVVRLAHPSDDSLVELAAALLPHKTLFLRGAGGLGPHGVDFVELGPGHILQNNESGIAAINLRSDGAELIASSFLASEEQRFLERARRILEGPAGRRPRATVSVASPLSILRELFTVLGEGTLIKLGAAIVTHQGWVGVEPKKVAELLEASFKKSLKSEFFSRTPLSVHVEEEWRGLALIESGTAGVAFLSKFAVLPVARGEGLGQDLWRSLCKGTPSLYWRSRPENPINTWYATVCDGMHRAGIWNVYWRGVPADQLSDLIRDAISRPEDFATRG